MSTAKTNLGVPASPRRTSLATAATHAQNALSVYTNVLPGDPPSLTIQTQSCHERRLSGAGPTAGAVDCDSFARLALPFIGQKLCQVQYPYNHPIPDCLGTIETAIVGAYSPALALSHVRPTICSRTTKPQNTLALGSGEQLSQYRNEGERDHAPPTAHPRKTSIPCADRHSNWTAGTDERGANGGLQREHHSHCR